MKMSYWLSLCTLAAFFVIATPPLHAAPIEFLEDDATGDFDILGELRFASPEDIDVRIVFNYQENGDHYVAALVNGVAKFYRVAGGVTTFIGTAGRLTGLDHGAETVLFTLQRRDWRMAFVWGTEVIARAYDSTFADGRAGIVSNSGAFEELLVQPVGDIFAEDDFVREEDAASVWLPMSGKWEQRTLRDDDQAGQQEADKSANAFSYFGTTDSEAAAITTNGYWFWDVYSMQAAVKPLDDAATGLVLYFQDPSNYIAVRMLGRNNVHGGKVDVQVVKNGVAATLAETAGGVSPGQWYELRAAVSSGVVHVWVDDELRIAARTEAFGQGKIGLYTESRKGAFFDDVECGPWELFVEDFTDGAAKKWQASGGEWLLSDNSFVTASSSPSLAVAGRTAWERYECSATVHPTAGGGAGIVVGYQNPQDYVLLRWSLTGTEYAGKAQIVRVIGDAAKILAEAPVVLPVKNWYRVKASLLDGLLRLDIEGRKQVECFTPGVIGGAAGVFGAGKGTSFDNVLVELLPPKTPARVTKEFADTTQHPEMAEWASTYAAWVKPEQDGTAVWWTKGEYFGDHALVITIPDISAQSGTMQMIVSSPEPGMPGYALSVETTKEQHTLGLSLKAGDIEIAAEMMTLADSAATISYERRGNWLVVMVNGALALDADVVASSQVEMQMPAGKSNK